MAEAKKKSKALGKGITPKGVLVFPHLQKPDTKFKAEGEYHTKIKLEGADAAALITSLDKMYDAGFEVILDEKAKDAKDRAKLAKTMKRADKPYKADLDDEGNETGAYVFSFKQKASFKTKDGAVITKKVDLFDASKTAWPKNGPMIYGGSTGKIAYEVLPFFTPAVGAGITLRLLGAQIIDLRTGGAKDADAYGFGEEGDGLEPAEESNTESSGEESSGGKSDDEDF